MKKSRFGRIWIATGVAVVAAVALVLVFVLPGAGGLEAASAPVTAGPSASPSMTAGPSASPSTTAAATPAPSAGAKTAEPKATPNPVRKKPVPPPTPGTTKQTVEPVTAGPTKSGKFDQPVTPQNQVTVRLVKTSASVIEAMGPGDTSGPAIVVTVSIENGSAKPVNLDSAAVALLYGRDGVMGTPSPAELSKPFGGSIEPGATAEGTYVFRVAEKTQDKVTVLVTYTAGAAAAKFDGAVR